jgi:salicylate hydroxylase
VGAVEQDTWTRESWTNRGDLADALAAFDGWHPQVRAILRAADETYLWPRALRGRRFREVLHRYEQLRIPRTSRVQATFAENKTRFHLLDGPAQQERDARMATGTTDFAYSAVAWIYGHDAAAARWLLVNPAGRGSAATRRGR